MKTLLLVPGDQLFDPRSLLKPALTQAEISKIELCFMAEDEGLCTHFRYHKAKLVFFLSAMREHARALEAEGFRVHFERLSATEKDTPYAEKLRRVLASEKITRVISFEIEDRFFEEEMQNLFAALGIEHRALPSPMFLTSREEFLRYRKKQKKLFMKTFYEEQRRRLGVLLEADGSPTGGQWSFDEDNRKKLPKNYRPPVLPVPEASPEQREVRKLVAQRFQDHPGSADAILFPVRRADAVEWLDDFVKHRLAHFGDYEDALSSDHPFLNHSLLTPLLNSGLLTPREVLEQVLRHAKRSGKIPLNSLEGFVRQLIGWREFIRGVYRTEGERQEKANFWNHQRELAPSWYDGTTGLPPLDEAIRKALRYGYTHHIERLMILGNLMLLTEIEPRAAYRWFMELFVDSADWVMGPNVFGMGIFSDGGTFATKPYLCGSNYLLKMGYGPKGPWCETMDGLYWRFIGKNRDFFGKNPRLSMMVKLYDKIPDGRRRALEEAAEEFLRRNTLTGRR
jgi:deoxyribodipyrimidine photolyase-related protein